VYLYLNNAVSSRQAKCQPIGAGSGPAPESECKPQQQQQQQQQQLPNGIGSSHCNSNSNGISSTCNSGTAMIHANNSNLIAAGHLAQAAGPAHNAPSSGSALNAGKCAGDSGGFCCKGACTLGKNTYLKQDNSYGYSYCW